MGSPKKAARLQEGDKVEGNYRGRGKWYKGKISRDRGDGTYDIAYDDGESEMRVPEDMIRSFSHSFIEVGDRVECRYRDGWVCGRVLEGARNGIILVAFDDGRVEKIEEEDVRLFSLSHSRLQYYNMHGSQVDRHKIGTEVDCYFYKAQPYSGAKEYDHPARGIIRNVNLDGKYTVEFMRDGSILDDVDPKYIKELDAHSQERNAKTSEEAQNIWSAVINMASAMHKRKNFKSTYTIPRLDDMEKQPDDTSKLEFIIGKRLTEEFQDVFAKVNKSSSLYVNEECLMEGFELLGAKSTVLELRNFWKKFGRRRESRKVLEYDYVDFVLAFANIFFSVDKFQSTYDSGSIGKVLRLGQQWKDLGNFAAEFGTRVLHDIEHAFDKFSEKFSSSNENLLLASKILEVFHFLGRAIVVSRLQDWMIQADVRPQDYLTLADFVAVYAFFFRPTNSNQNVNVASNQQKSLSEISIQVMQDENWRGTADQVSAFMRRITSGRVQSLVEKLILLRDAFDQFDEKTGEVSGSNIEKLLSAAKIESVQVESYVNSFHNNLTLQRRSTFTFPEMISHFGPLLQGICESTTTIKEAFASLRIHLSEVDVIACADLALKIINNILSHPDDSKFWQISVNADEFNVKIWIHEGGKLLMKAIGFGDVQESVAAEGRIRRFISLVAPGSKNKLPNNVIAALTSRKYDIEEEIKVVDGRPSLSSAVRELRSHHSKSEVKDALFTAATIIVNILTHPKDTKVYRIKRPNPTFHRSIGRLTGSMQLMNAIGFNLVDNQKVVSELSRSGVYIFQPFPNQPPLFAAEKGTDNFKFPALDTQSESFLLKRKSELDFVLRELDNLSDNMHVDASKSQASASDKNAAKHVLKKTHTEKDREKMKKKKNIADDKKVTGSDTIIAETIEKYTVGATSAQQTQITMIKAVFKEMDVDGDGILTHRDVKAYFSAKGQDFSDQNVRKWIQKFDVDQDGAVSFLEFLSAFALQMDPASKHIDEHGVEHTNNQASDVAVAFGTVRLGNTTAQVFACCDALELYVNRILDSPNEKSFWRLDTKDLEFQNKIGKLFGGVKLVQSLGFEFENNGEVLALRDPRGKVWDSLPQEIKVRLSQRLRELLNHKESILYPTISNIAAVSCGISELGDNLQKAQKWKVALQTILSIITKIKEHPGNQQFYRINLANELFRARVSTVDGAIGVLVSLGFRETDDGHLALDLNTNIPFLEARRLEIECGLQKLAAKIDELQELSAAMNKKAADKEKQDEKKTSANETKKNISPDKKRGANAQPITAAAGDAELQKSLRQRESVLQEEMTRRLKAESALQQQKTIVDDLQAEVATLKEREAKRLSLKFGLTMSRMDLLDKKDVQHDLKVLGIAPEIEKTATTASAPANATAQSKAKPTKSAKAVNGIAVQSKLEEQIQSGSNRFTINGTSQKLVKKGMMVMVGSGSTVEIRKVTGFGSVVVDAPFTYMHNKGEQVLFFTPNPKGVAKMEKMYATEFVRDYLISEIVPSIYDTVEERELSEKLDKVYSVRPICRNHFVVDFSTPVRHVLTSEFATTLLPTKDGHMISIEGGQLTKCSFSLNFVDLFLIYHLSKLISEQSFSLEIISAPLDCNDFLQFVGSHPDIFAQFQELASYHNFETFEGMCLKYAVNNTISWASYILMVRGQEPSLKFPSESFDNDVKKLLLWQIFCAFDCDNIGTISLKSLISAFSLLDGSVYDLRLIDSSIVSSVGSVASDMQFNFRTFCNVRLHYSNALQTDAAGFKLYVMLHFHHAISKLATLGCFESSGHLKKFIFADLVPYLPKELLDSSIIYLNSTLRHLAVSQSEVYTSNAMITSFFGQSSKLIGISFDKIRWSQYQEAIFELKLDITGLYSYGLSQNGELHMFDCKNNRTLSTQRVLWAEPLPSRRLEAYEKHLSWLKASGYLDNNIKEYEINATSALLSELCSTLCRRNNMQFLNVDTVTGLIAVNCSVTSNSIAIHEPLSMRRLYRIQLPWKNSQSLNDVVAGLSTGLLTKIPDLQQDDLKGCLLQCTLCSSRAALLCLRIGYPSISVINIANGEHIMDLTGHFEQITCLSLYCEEDVFFTGSEDKTVRVWKMSNIPILTPDLTIANDNSEIAKLEKHIIENKMAVSIVKGKSAKNAKNTCRNFLSALCSVLRVFPAWRLATISGVSDGTSFYNYIPAGKAIVEVEVVFEDSTSRYFNNVKLLRTLSEMADCPDGPPRWSSPSAMVQIGSQVSIFDVSQSSIILALSRYLNVESTDDVDREKYTMFLTEIIRHSGGDVFDVKEILDAVELGQSLSIAKFVSKIFCQSEGRMTHSDRLLTGNESPIKSVVFSKTSKTIVALDDVGTLCVWDPCARSTVLSITKSGATFPFVGEHPYRLVSISNLHRSLTETPFNIVNMTNMTIPECPSPDCFPVKCGDINKAIQFEVEKSELDLKLLRCFIYVYKDLTFNYLETSTFLLPCVTLQHPEYFLRSKFIPSDVYNDTCMRDIYDKRNDTLRIIYAVSSAHTSLEAFTGDLQSYGVIHRGYTITPSEHIQVFCFERDPSWLERTMQLKPKKSPAIRKTRTGILVRVNVSTQTVLVALDYSNDIVIVDTKRILRIWSHTNTPNDILSLGSRVEFSISNKSETSHSDHCMDVLVVNLEWKSEKGDSMASLLPISISRCSFSTIASRLDDPVTITAFDSLRESCANMTSAYMRKWSISKFVSSIFESSLQQFELGYIGQLMENLALVNTDKKISNVYTASSVYSGNMGLLNFAVTLFVLFTQNETIPPSHPMLVFADCLLNGSGMEITSAFKDLHANRTSKLSDLLSHVWKQSLRRDKIYSTESSMFLSSILDCDKLSWYSKALNSDLTPIGLWASNEITKLLVSVNKNSRELSGSAAAKHTINIPAANTLSSLLMEHELIETSLLAKSVFMSGLGGIASSIIGKSLTATRNIWVSIKDAHKNSKPPTVLNLHARTDITMPTPGKYVVLSARTLPVPCKGMKISVIEAKRNKVDASAEQLNCVFLVVNVTSSQDDINIYKQISKFPGLVETFDYNGVIVPVCAGIEFDGISNPDVVYYWRKDWISLSTLLQKEEEGFLLHNKFDFMRMISMKLLEAVHDIVSRGISIRSLSLSSVFIDPNLQVRVLLLPVYCCSHNDKSTGNANDTAAVYDSSWLTMIEDARKTVDCDYISVGIMLYLLAFGRKGIYDISNANPSLFFDNLTSVNFDSFDGSVFAQFVLNFVNTITAKLAMVQPSFAKSIFDIDGVAAKNAFYLNESQSSSHDLCLRLIEDLMLTPMSTLKSCRDDFIDEALKSSWTRSMAISFWERSVQLIVKAVSAARIPLTLVQEKIMIETRKTDKESLLAFCRQVLALELTSVELDTLINAFSHEKKSCPFDEKAGLAFKKISLVIPEMQQFVFFHQLLFSMTSILNSPTDSMVLRDMSQLSFFYPLEESKVLNCYEEYAQLVKQSYTIDEFVVITVVDPLVIAAQSIYNYSRTDRILDAAHSISSIMSRLEELLFHAEKIIAGHYDQSYSAFDGLKETAWKECFDTVDEHWVLDHCTRIIEKLLRIEAFDVLVSLVMRFQKLDLEDLNGGIPSNSAVDTLLEGTSDSTIMKSTRSGSESNFSVRSKLMMRTIKFIQNIVSSLSTMSKYVILNDNQGQTHSNLLFNRLVSENLYITAVHVILMLLFGEESKIKEFGKFNRLFGSSFNKFVGFARSVNLIEIVSSFENEVMQAKWNYQSARLFEAKLAELVGDDGKGSKQVSMSFDVLSNAFKAIEEHLLTDQIVDSNTANKVGSLFTRGSIYFTQLMRLYRNVISYESAAVNSETVFRNGDGIVNFVLSLIPNAGVTITPVEIESGRNSYISQTTIIPDPITTQQIQLIIDSRFVSKITSYMSKHNLVSRTNALKFAHRAWIYLLSLHPSICSKEPFASLATGLSSSLWVCSLCDCLRGKVANIEVAGYAIQTLCLMSCRKEWTSCWDPFDVMSLLCGIMQSKSSQYADLRLLCNSALKNIATHSREHLDALLDVRSNLVVLMPDISKDVPRLEEILDEARDLAFGCTLQEQNRFADTMQKWAFNTFALNTTSQATLSLPWDLIYDLLGTITRWTTRLCDSLVLLENAPTKKGKADMLVMVMGKLMKIIDRVLLHSVHIGEPESLPAIIGVLWSSNTEMAGVGLLPIIDQLSTWKSITDPLQPVECMAPIIAFICTLLSKNWSNRNMVQNIIDCGAGRALVKFVSKSMGTLAELAKSGQTGLLIKSFKDIAYITRNVWSCILNFFEWTSTAIIDSNILRLICDGWLKSTTSVSAIALDGYSNALIIRAEAVLMLVKVVLKVPKNTTLLNELERMISVSQLCKRESETLRTKGTKKSNTETCLLSAVVLASIAMIESDTIGILLKDIGVSDLLIFSSRQLTALHPAVTKAWMRWSTQAAPNKTVPAAVEDIEKVELDNASLDAAVSSHGVEIDGAEELFHKLLPQKEKELFSRTIPEEVKDVVVPTGLQLGTVDLPVVMDRLGQLVLGIKAAFDRIGGDRGFVSNEEAVSLLMDLGLRDAKLSGCISKFDPFVDLTSFLTVYSAACGLNKATKTSDSENNDMFKFYWVPTLTGDWVEMDNGIVESIARAAEPYSLHEIIPQPSKSISVSAVDIWVSLDEVADILNLTGVKNLDAADVSVGECIRRFRQFLPGLTSGKLCFQELLLIAKFHLDEGASAAKLLQDQQDAKSNKSLKDLVKRPRPYSLPTKAAAMVKSRESIREEFRRFDIRKEGKITLLGMKSVLELENLEVEGGDEAIRKWFQEIDKSQKGFIEFDDYESYFAQRSKFGVTQSLSSDSMALFGSDSNPKYSTFQAGDRDNHRDNGDNNSLFGNKTSVVAVDKEAVLKRAFLRYDFDNDGMISIQDLEVTLNSGNNKNNGKAYTRDELIKWIRKRDLSGLGAVCFHDFMRFYKNK